MTAACWSWDCEQGFWEDVGNWSHGEQSEASFMGAPLPHTHTHSVISLLPLESVYALGCTLESPGEIKNTNAQRLNLLGLQGNFFLLLPQRVLRYSQG